MDTKTVDPLSSEQLKNFLVESDSLSYPQFVKTLARYLLPLEAEGIFNQGLRIIIDSDERSLEKELEHEDHDDARVLLLDIISLRKQDPNEDYEFWDKMQSSLNLYEVKTRKPAVLN